MSVIRQEFSPQILLIICCCPIPILAMDILDKTWNGIQAFFLELHLIQTSRTLTFGRHKRQRESDAHIRSGVVVVVGGRVYEGFPNGLSSRLL